MLTDNFKRRFNYLRLSVTDACNFRCNYCLPDGYCKDGKPQALSLDEIARVAEAFAISGTRKIRITGGEPSLRKDLTEIIRVCKQTPGIDTVALTTNGYKLSKEIHGYIDAGLDALNISMDSLRPESFHLITGHDKLTEVLKGMDMALDAGLKKVKINTVLMKDYNGREISRFLDFIKHKPVSLRLIELMETGNNREFFEAQHVSGESIKQQLLLEGWVNNIRSADAGPAQEFSHPDYAGNFGLIMPYSKGFCDNCNRLRVSSQGNLHLCLFAEDHQPLRPLLKTHSPQELAEQLHVLVHGKKASHYLHDHQSGSTENLSMLGG